MNDKQTEAVRLANALTIDGWKNVYNVNSETMNEAANELIRLHNANVELLDSLETLVAIVGLTAFKYEAQREVLQEAVDIASATIAKYGGK